MLTTSAVKAARPRPCAYKLADERGLHLFVAPTGLRSWRLRCRIGGSETTLTLGAWPELSLDGARSRRDVARAAIAAGRDPRTVTAMTFEPAARAWHAFNAGDWTPVHAADVLTSLERDVFPAIGAAKLEEIDAPQVLAMLREIERRGCVETARRVHYRVRATFKLAQSEGWCERNPALGLEEALRAAAPAKRMPALATIEDARALLAAAELVDAAPAITLASRFLALTAVRLATLRGARWCELEDLDGPAPLWRVPAARMKLAMAKKADAEHDHLVPLSAAAVAVLREARALGGGELVFPGRDPGRPIGESAIGALYDRAGFAGRHVPHGWRATFSTVMNERHRTLRDAIDQALAHTPKNMDATEGAYNRAKLLDLRREVFDLWGAMLAGPSPQA